MYDAENDPAGWETAGGAGLRGYGMEERSGAW